MKPKSRYIMPGDYCRAMNLQLSRGEVITLLNALIEDIKAYERKGEAYLNLNTLAEKLECFLTEKPAKP